jgi:hypothetical protein
MTATDIVSVLQRIGLFLVLVGVIWLLVNFGFYLRGLIAPEGLGSHLPQLLRPQRGYFQSPEGDVAGD